MRDTHSAGCHGGTYYNGNEAGLSLVPRLLPCRMGRSLGTKLAGLTVAAVGSEEPDRTRTIPRDVVTVSRLTCALLQTAQAIVTRRTHCNNRTQQLSHRTSYTTKL